MSATIDPSDAPQPVSPARVRANRRNARKSTGPRTIEGKARSSLNAVKHGLCTDNVQLLPGETAERYWHFRHAMVDALNPQDLAQLTLAERAASCAWRLRRVEPAEATILASHAVRRRLDPFETEFALDPLGRPVQGLTPAGRRRLAGQMAKAPAVASAGEALALAVLDAEADGAALERLGRYEQRLQNQLHRALRELRVLQRQPANEREDDDDGESRGGRCPYVPAGFYDGPEGVSEDAETTTAGDDSSIVQNEPNAAPSAASDEPAEGCDAAPQEPESDFSGTGVPPVLAEPQGGARTTAGAEEEGSKT